MSSPSISSLNEVIKIYKRSFGYHDTVGEYGIEEGLMIAAAQYDEWKARNRLNGLKVQFENALNPEVRARDVFDSVVPSLQARYIDAENNVIRANQIVVSLINMSESSRAAREPKSISNLLITSVTIFRIITIELLKRISS